MVSSVVAITLAMECSCADDCFANNLSKSAYPCTCSDWKRENVITFEEGTVEMCSVFRDLVSVKAWSARLRWEGLPKGTQRGFNASSRSRCWQLDDGFTARHPDSDWRTWFSF